jgi:cell wall-associated NlpC family hydrolase
MKLVFNQYFTIIFFSTFLVPAFTFAQRVESKNFLSACIIENAQQLIGSPYVAGTLEVSGPERLVYFTDKFDCVTFVEYVIALSIYQSGDTQNETFEDILQQIRYRDGTIDGYGSRLHYFTEWILENEKNGYIRNVTADISLSKYKKDIRFMTVNADKYPALTNRSELQKVKDAQHRISSNYWHFVPKNVIHQISDQIQNGDIIAITTGVKDLDVVHTGFAFRYADGVHLLHASESEGKVTISKNTLTDYLNSHKRQTGIILLRPR